MMEFTASLHYSTTPSLHRLPRRLPQWSGQIFADTIEDAIDETAGFGAAKGFGQLDGFVDGNDRWDVVAVEHFINREAQNVAIDGGDAVEIEIL